MPRVYNNISEKEGCRRDILSISKAKDKAMIKIITNTASLMTQEEGAKLGIDIIPITVSFENRSIRDYADISSDGFVELIKGGDIPSSSQPSAGDIMDQFNSEFDDAIMFTVADGLSGEYMSAVGLKNAHEEMENVHVVNSGSLGCVLGYVARQAARLRDEGKDADDIISLTAEAIASSLSYVIPADFEYLKNSGRITNLMSKIGGSLRFLPVLTQTEDRRRIVPVTVRRAWRAAAGTIIQNLKKKKVDENYLIYILYADNEYLAEQIKKQFETSFPENDIEVKQLSPSLITHGGPGCIVVQAVCKITE